MKGLTKANILITLISLSAILKIVSGIPWIPEPKLNETFWVERHLGFVENTDRIGRDNPVNILFLGDSITEGWVFRGYNIFLRHYAHLGTAIYGIWADRTENLLWRIQIGEVQPSRMQPNPKVCVLQIGTNNLKDGWAPNYVASGILQNILELRRRLPNTKILLMGLFPRDAEGVDTRSTSKVNEIIKNFDNKGGGGRMIRFLDMTEHFYSEQSGIRRELYSPDLLHLSKSGYEKWAEVMNPLLTEMLYY